MFGQINLCVSSPRLEMSDVWSDYSFFCHHLVMECVIIGDQINDFKLNVIYHPLYGMNNYVLIWGDWVT